MDVPFGDSAILGLIEVITLVSLNPYSNGCSFRSVFNNSYLKFIYHGLNPYSNGCSFRSFNRAEQTNEDVKS